MKIIFINKMYLAKKAKHLRRGHVTVVCDKHMQFILIIIS